MFIPIKYDENNQPITKPITDPTFIDDERRRLFIHTNDNKSLARYVYEAKQKFPDNLFLNFLQPEIVKGDLPSKVKFRANNRDLAKDEIMYQHLVDLLVNERNIDDNYTTRKLFQDLMG